MTAPDLGRFRDAVQLRDRCRQVAMEHHERCGLPPSFAYANATYDAIVELIREDERRRGDRQGGRTAASDDGPSGCRKDLGEDSSDSAIAVRVDGPVERVADSV